MIHYQLICSREHEFDGWFSSSGSFESQAEAGLLECPICADTSVSRALMSPSLVSGRAVANPAGDTEPEAPTAQPPRGGSESTGSNATVAVAPQTLPDEMRAMLQRLRAEVERRCDYVGPAFPDEVRKIHYGQRETRGIYGEASAEQAEALADEGIRIASIPWVKRADA